MNTRREHGIEVGAIFQDRYEILHELSEGGFGVVLKARQLTTGQDVAIKCLQHRRTGDALHEAYLARFRREMMLCAQLHHPNIVRLIDTGQSGELVYAVFEYVPGRDLARVLADEGTLAPTEAGYLMAQVLDALSCAHARGIIHRDLKPSNIMLADTGARRNALILDFGIGAIANVALQDSTYVSLTSPLDRMGTPAYSAPEQLRGEEMSTSADLYSWGLVFLECLTGQRAIRGRTLAEVIHEQLDEGPIPIPAALRGHPLDELLRVATAKDPAHRALPTHTALRWLESCDMAALDLSPATPGGDVPMQSPDSQQTLGLEVGAQLAASAAAPGDATGDASAAAPELSHAPLRFESPPRDEPPPRAKSPVAERRALRRRRASTARGAFGLEARGAIERRQITAASYAFRCTPGARASLDVEEQAERVAACKAICTGIVQARGGFVASAVGNGVVVFYGFPKAHGDDARRAASDALDVSAQVARDPNTCGQVHVRVGVHTGVVVIRDADPDAGLADAFVAEIAGEAPEVAGELVAQTPDGAVWVSATTERLLANRFDTAPAGFCRLGAHERSVFRVVARRDPRSEAAGSEPALVGRAEDMAQLVRAWRSARDGAGRAILLAGEAGVGKSRLLRSLRAAIAGAQHAWLSCRCAPDGQHDALRPIATLLERELALRDEMTDADKLDALDALLARYGESSRRAAPLLAALLGIAPGDRYPPVVASARRRRALTLEALLSLLVELATRRPLVLAIEDLHWADPSTTELVSLLAAEVSLTRILLVVTTTARAHPAWDPGEVERIELGGLADADARALIARVAGARTLPRHMIDQLVARTDGVPLFIEELTRTTLESMTESMTERDDSSGDADPALEIPATLRDLLMARLDGLTRAKATAQLAAVIGREFTRAQLAAVSPLSDDALDAALDEMVAAELVYRRREGDAYAFRHALLQETAYDSLPRRHRAELHGRIARALEERFPNLVARRPEVLAEHHARAGAMTEAADHGLRAAQAALDRSANAEAVAHCKRALAWLAQVTPGRARAERELAFNAILTPALMATYGFNQDEYRERMERLLTLVEVDGDSPHAFTALWGLHSYHFCRAQYDEAQAFGERYTALAERMDHTAHRAVGANLLGMVYYYQGRLAEAHEQFERVVALRGADPDAPQIVYGLDTQTLALSYWALVCWKRGFLDRGHALAAQALARADTTDHANSQALARLFFALLHYYEDDAPAVADHARALLAIARGADLPRWLDFGQLLASWAARDVAAAREALSAYDLTGHRLRATYWAAMVAECEVAAGDLDTALARLEGCVWIATETSEFSNLPRVLDTEAACRRRRGDVDGARACLDEALDLARAYDARTLALRCATSLYWLHAAASDDASDSASDNALARAARDLQALYDEIGEGRARSPLIAARAALDDWNARVSTSASRSRSRSE